MMPTPEQICAADAAANVMAHRYTRHNLTAFRFTVANGGPIWKAIVLSNGALRIHKETPGQIQNAAFCVSWVNGNPVYSQSESLTQ